MEEGLSVEELVEPDKLAKDILSFIKHKYPKNDYRLFKLKVYDTGCSYKDLSDYTGVSVSTIYRKINSINNAIRSNISFCKPIFMYSNRIILKFTNYETCNIQ